MQPDGIQVPSPEVMMLRRNKQSGYNYRWRRQDDWTENYTLYRDKVTYNRLTQRQSVNIPLMKTVIRTLLADVDDMPLVYLENLDNDKQAEVFQNEYWKWTLDLNKAELKDIQDKRQVFMFGRSFDCMQIINGRVVWTIEDPEDFFVERYVDPIDLDTARVFIHTHIFRALSALDEDPDYDKEAVARLKEFHATDMGLIKSKTNADSLIRKTQKLKDLGLSDADAPLLGETYVELSLHFVMRKEADDEEEQYYLYVECDDMEILMKKRLEEVIGVTKDHYWRNHLPYNSWADDVDKQDFWTDGIADIVRTPNKVLNSWYSQMVENRALRNFGMKYYDATIEGFDPQTYQPIPFGHYATPGDPNKIIKEVVIPDLGKDSLEDMNFVIEMVQKATAATDTQQGTDTPSKVTLGEVQLALTQAKSRVKGMSKFYTPAWEQRAQKFLKFIEAAPDKLDAVTIYKKGRNTSNIYTREISPEDWMSKSGYSTRVWSQDEKDADATNSIQKLNAAKQMMPDNPKLTEIIDRKMLEYADLKPEEINDVLKYEEEKLASPQPDVPKEMLDINYKDAPPDIQRQIEASMGFQPSKLGDMPNPNTQPAGQGSTPAPTPPQTQLPIPPQAQAAAG